MNELQDITRIETEINMLKNQTAQNIIEIGKRLNEAKAMLNHGEWGKWLEERVEFTERTAQRLMRVANEYPTSMSVLGTGKLFALLQIPQEEREDFIKENPVDEMTTRELQQAIREKKVLEEQLKELEKNQRVEYKTIEVVPHDYVQTRQALQNKQFELDHLMGQVKILEEKADLNKKNAERYKELKEQIETLSKQKDDIGRRLRSTTELSGLVVETKNFFQTKYAPMKYSGAIREAVEDEVVRRNLSDILTMFQDWINEMSRYMSNRNNIIDAEVIK